MATRPPVRRHKRHRDLPARVRRRQAIAGGVVLAAIGVFAVTTILGGDDGGGDAEPEEISLERLVGQAVVGRMGRSGATKSLLTRVRKGELGGVVAFPRNERSLRQDTARLQKAAKAGGNPPLLVMIDQEGGPVKRLPGPPTVSPTELGTNGDTAAATQQGELTGRYLAGVGVNVDLAPVADVAHPDTADTIAERTFGTDPTVVSEMVLAFSEGLEAGGVAPTVKHFPGLGFATENTDFSSKVTIRASQEEIKNDLAPFAAAIDSEVPLVLLSNAIYPTYGSADPAAWSEPIIRGELRERLGFTGVVLTDDLESAATKAVLSPERGALLALRAGADMVLFAKGERTSAGAYRFLARATGAGRLERGQLEEAYDRIVDLKRDFARDQDEETES